MLRGGKMLHRGNAEKKPRETMSLAFYRGLFLLLPKDNWRFVDQHW